MPESRLLQRVIERGKNSVTRPNVIPQTESIPTPVSRRVPSEQFRYKLLAALLTRGNNTDEKDELELELEEIRRQNPEGFKSQNSSVQDTQRNYETCLNIANLEMSPEDQALYGTQTGSYAGDVNGNRIDDSTRLVFT